MEKPARKRKLQDRGSTYTDEKGTKVNLKEEAKTAKPKYKSGKDTKPKSSLKIDKEKSKQDVSTDKDKLSVKKGKHSVKKEQPQKTKGTFAKTLKQKGQSKPKFQKPGPKSHDNKSKWKTGQKRKGGESGDSAKRPKLEELKKKERKQVRKQLKNNFELAQKAKTAWEVIRKHDCKADTRNKLITELCDLLEGRVLELVKAHDTVRVIQCCVQYGTEEQRTKIFEEIKDHIVELCKCKYSKFYVLKMFRYGSKEQRLFIMRAFHGKVCQLIRHTEASEVLEEAYNNHANAQERSALMEEFYGSRFAVFKASGVHTLEGILQKDPSQKDAIMDHMLRTLTPLLDKSVVKHTIVHKAIFDFLQHAPEKKRMEFIESMREVVVQILHTQDGARAAMHCLWYGTTKDRKMIIKSFKNFVVKICKEEFGHRVLMALFDCVDDTKIVSKVIIEEMMKSAYEVATDQYGRKVLLYLLVPRDPSHFHPDIVKQLQKGDNNPFSKKEVGVRRRELLGAASAALLKLLITHTKEMAYSNSNSQLALAILQHAQGVKKGVYTLLATLAAQELIPILVNDRDNMDDMHLVEHPSGHLLLKRILAYEKVEREKGEEPSSSLSACLLEELSDENIRSWLRINRGAFVLVSLADCGNQAAKDRICAVLKASGKNLSKLTSKGVQVLREKLDL